MSRYPQLLPDRVQHVAERIQRAAEKLASVLGDDSRMANELRDCHAELRECARLIHEAK